jgi:hypothetical protein
LVGCIAVSGCVERRIHIFMAWSSPPPLKTPPCSSSSPHVDPVRSGPGRGPTQPRRPPRPSRAPPQRPFLVPLAHLRRLAVKWSLPPAICPSTQIVWAQLRLRLELLCGSSALLWDSAALPRLALAPPRLSIHSMDSGLACSLRTLLSLQGTAGVQITQEP